MRHGLETLNLLTSAQNHRQIMALFSTSAKIYALFNAEFGLNEPALNLVASK